MVGRKVDGARWGGERPRAVDSARILSGVLTDNRSSAPDRVRAEPCRKPARFPTGKRRVGIGERGGVVLGIGERAERGRGGVKECERAIGRMGYTDLANLGARTRAWRGKAVNVPMNAGVRSGSVPVSWAKGGGVRRRGWDMRVCIILS